MTSLLFSLWLGHRALVVGLLCGLGVGLLEIRAEEPATAAEFAEGSRLAAQLRASPPAEEMNLKGKLNLRDGSGPIREVPFQFRTVITTTNWMAVYRAQGLGTNPPAHPPLAVMHVTGQPNSYWQATSGDQESWNPLAEGETYDKPFAGSDFSIQDLGLEFLHWPKQRLIRTEMRKSRSCHVLESTNPRPQGQGYSRVVSWLDVESGGLLMAEAYDRQDKLLKEFSVNSMKKVDQRWQVQQMEIRNVQRRSRTRLEFEVK